MFANFTCDVWQLHWGTQKQALDSIQPLPREELVIDEVVCDGVNGEARKRVYLQFARNVATMRDDGVDGDEQVSRYLFVRHTLNETDDNLFLALRDGFRTFCVPDHAGDAS